MTPMLRACHVEGEERFRKLAEVELHEGAHHVHICARLELHILPQPPGKYIKTIWQAHIMCAYESELERSLGNACTSLLSKACL